jgi:hypothetical protein
VLQSHDQDLIVVSYALAKSKVPVVATNNDSGLLLLNHIGVISANVAAREGDSATAFGSTGTFSQFTGRASAGQGSSNPFKSTTAKVGAMRLRKGQYYATTSNTPLSTISSIALKPAIDPTGAGGRGQAQAIGSEGGVAIYIVGDRKLTELVMLPP